MESVHKAMLIRILEQLQGYWSLAKGFLILTQQTNDKKFIQKLYQMIRQEIVNIRDQQKKERIQSQLQQVYLQQRREAPTFQQDRKEAEQLLDALFLNS